MDNFIGQTLGQYRLEALLGTGGMGQVYRGVHQFLQRPAAIKVMLPHYAVNPQFRARFLQEARAAAALRHPNIVEVYEFGDHDQVLFLVMELMVDGSLSTLLRQQSGRPLPLPLALDLGTQIAEGLAAAHRMQVIHRDIKPANLLLHRLPAGSPGGTPYTIKINDFGLARLMEGGGVETMTGAPMGTLAYMSPEQCLGNKQLDGRSDLYALGIVLYEMTTGYQPFQIAGVSDALYKHVNTPPPPPRSMRADLPPALEDIILRCLAKKPEDRFATGTALATALQSVAGKTPGTPSFVGSQPYASTRTTLEAPAVAHTPPPISTMPGYSDKPRIRVTDLQGKTLQVVEVTSQGIIAGRQPDNALVLPSQAVSRQHLRVSWNGNQVIVTDLGSSNGTVLGETRLLPEVAQVWEERQMIRLGDFWLRLEGASAPLTHMAQAQQASRPPTPAPVSAVRNPSAINNPPSLANERISVSVTPKTLSITPGQPTTTQVSLTNLGSTVDWFTTTVEGVPPEWVQGAGQEVQLNPGMQESVNLMLNVARQPLNRAKDYPVTIRARSREQPQQSSTTTALWSVQPFIEESMRLEPRRVSGQGKAIFQVTLRNGGNLASSYSLRGDDDEQQLNYQFQYNPVELDVGQEARIPLKVQTRRHMLGRESRIPFQLHAGPSNAPPTQTASGEFVNKALLPGWFLPAIGVMLAAAVAISGMLGLLPFIGHASTLATPTPTSISQSITATPTSSTGTTPTPAGAPTATPSPTPTTAPTMADLALQYTGTWVGSPTDGIYSQLFITQAGPDPASPHLYVHAYANCATTPPTFSEILSGNSYHSVPSNLSLNKPTQKLATHLPAKALSGGGCTDLGTADAVFTGEPFTLTYGGSGLTDSNDTGSDTFQLVISFNNAEKTQLKVVQTETGFTPTTNFVERPDSNTSISATQFVGSWVNNDSNPNDITRLVISNNNQMLAITGSMDCGNGTGCNIGTIHTQFIGRDTIVATFVFDGSRPDASCCPNTPTIGVTFSFTDSGQAELNVIETYGTNTPVTIVLLK